MSYHSLSASIQLTSFTQLLGVDDEHIVKDYTLTTFGLQPVIPLFVKRFREEDVYRNNWQGALATSTAK